MLSIQLSSCHYYTYPCVTILDFVHLFGYVVLVIHVYLIPTSFISFLENQ